jgi:sulfide:quinone oxidoreductase
MKRLLVLGAGTAGTMVVNKLRPLLTDDEWAITVVDQDDAHQYQPGFLFIPFGPYRPGDIVKPRRDQLRAGVDLVLGEIDLVRPDQNTVELADGRTLSYDYLVIATGTSPRPDQTPGMMGAEWRKSVFDFYTLDGARALARKLATWEGGRLVVHITEMPIKCPPAPLEFSFLADSFFEKRGIRDRVDITYVTPLDGAFTKPVASRMLGGMLEERHIAIEPDFYIERVDDEAKTIVSYDERVIPFDLLVTVPLNMGADFVARSGMGDELNYVPVDRQTFLSPKWDNVFAIGDASDVPTSKAGSVAHFAVDVFTHNFLQHVSGEEMTHRFDGHANCFVESGSGRAMLIDFNYDVEPLPGKYPIPVLGPLTLLAERRMNHWGKLMFKWIYWHGLLPGRRLPVPSSMSMTGKEVATTPTRETEKVQ